MIGNIDILVKELCKLPKEVVWVEFKHNKRANHDWPGQSNHLMDYICKNILAID